MSARLPIWSAVMTYIAGPPISEGSSLEPP
jgi:hypothetical protein